MKFAPLVMSLLAAAIIYSPADAAPSAKLYGSSIQIREAVDDNAISVINAEKAKLQKGLVVALEKIGDADLARLCEAFPDIQGISIRGNKGLTSIAPLAKLSKLTSVDLSETVLVTDYSPLSSLTGLTELKVRSDGLSGDLTWMKPLVNLKKVEISSGSLCCE